MSLQCLHNLNKLSHAISCFSHFITGYHPHTLLKPHVLEQKLCFYPDKSQANRLIEGFTNGFSIGVSGMPPPCLLPPNSKIV